MDVDKAVWFRNDRKRNCVALSFSCGKGMSAPLRVRSRPAALLPSLQDEQKGGKIRPIVESLDGGR